MDDGLPRLVVLDDSQEFLDFIETGLGSCFRFVCLRYQPGPTQSQVLAQIRREEPDHLLLDLNLGRSEFSHELLEQLTTQEALPQSCKVWIISQGGHGNEAEILEGFQRINASTQNRLLSKPITPREVCAELLDESVYDADDSFGDAFPLPFRVLSRKGRIAYANVLWTKRDYPNPTDSAAWLDNGEVPDHRDYVGSFFGSGKAGFTLYSFRLEQGDEPFLGQIVEQHPLNPLHTNLPKTLEHIFRTMRDAGFTRGRFYYIRPLTRHRESDAYDSVAELSRLSYTAPPGLELPYRFPVTGEIRVRLEAYGEMDKEKLAKRLHYRIRTAREDRDAHDPTIDELNQLLEVDNLDSWLEVPIWIRDDFTRKYDEPAHRMTGLLVFDRAGPDARTGIDREVTPENVDPLGPLLRSLLCHLSVALKRIQDDKLKEYEHSMRLFSQTLLELDNTKQRYQEVLEALRRASDARSGIMVTHGNDPDILEIVATEGESLPAGLTKLRLPLEANHHPIVRAFNTKRQDVWQDFQNGPQVGELIEGVRTDSSKYWQILHAGEQEQFIHWLHDEVKGLIAIPVMIGTERAIGGITLQFDRPWSITRRKEIQVNAVLQRARWVMQQALHEKEQFYWQQTLGHDLKSDLYTMGQNLHIMEQEHTELSASPRWRQIKRYLLDSTDLAENWLDMLRESRVKNDPPFSPSAAIQNYVDLNQQRIVDDALRLIWHPSPNDTAWTHPLSGNRAIFARVMRTLLDNTFKFGRACVPEDDGVEITLTAGIEKGMWVVEIQNPGKMTAEEYELRFKAGEIPRERKADGAHVGLSVAYRWARHFGGTLKLENGGDNRVQACLSWPISQSETEEN